MTLPGGFFVQKKNVFYKKNYTFHKRKVWIVFLLCMAMTVGLIGRLVYLMGFRSDYYYEKVIDQPYYFFAYAIGYCEVSQIYRDTKNELGDKFDLPTYLKTYLDFGPASFDLIKEKIGVWTDELLQDVG